MDDLLRQFESMLQQAGTGTAGSVDLLLMQMEPEQAGIFRLCAIPHQFDARTIQALVPDLDEASARSIHTEFAGLSTVLRRGRDELALHDDVRQYLFQWWMEPEHRARFSEASRRLANYFAEQAASSQGVEHEACERNRLFHEIGVDPDEGFEAFSHYLKEQRHRFRLSECSALLTLAKEYEPMLTPRQRCRLQYYEGRLALDLSQWNRAVQQFEQLLRQEGVPLDVRVKTQKRLGLAYSELRQFDRAESVLKEALETAQSTPDLSTIVDDVMHDLACVYRDVRKVKEAERLFERAIVLAEGQNDRNTLAVVFNSMGTLYRQLGRSREAVQYYGKSLDHLTEKEDHFRRAQVYNNLGMAYGDLNEWEKSADMLGKSLAIKREAGDTRGTAIALNNLARVYLNLQDPARAIEVSTQAAALFEQVKDSFHGAQAMRNLARLYANQGDVEAAARAESEANRLASQTNGSRPTEPSAADHLSISERLVESPGPRRRLGCIVALVLLGLFMLLSWIGVLAG